MAARITLLVLIGLISTGMFGQTAPEPAAVTSDSLKMKIEIWSDVVCPFCYIGKRKLEQALEQFPQRDQVEIIWKSFQLDPGTPSNGGNYLQHLSERKGWSLDYTKQVTSQVTQMAAGVGLTYHFEKAILANSFDAHRLAHVAAKHGLQDKASEALFKAHFVEGKDIANHQTLVEIGQSIGLDPVEIKNALENKLYEEEIRQEIAEAQTLRISGVPFFVFDRKFAVSGAQDSSVFLQTLQRALEARQ
ncbi:MAG TPA: DsbA family oxidoreductase [Saprospiraceae bacterium]|nr:DsbA family oxidoreductase [Saprospiraceae bacterium]